MTTLQLSKKKEDMPVEMESQFILRLPPEPAQELMKAVKCGANSLKDRLSIQLENDMRHGMVRFDDCIWPAKLVDLPAIIESHKTIDRKTFYKTADICQMLICTEDDESPKTPPEEEDTKKKKDLHKVDKKYLWPHGVTPPLKNVRKRRFRKTLKKKVVDAPETEKEVKRLFRVDNEAVNVKWEVITEEEDGVKQKNMMGESINSSAASPAVSGPLFSNSQSLDIGEHDIFGEVVSTSDEDVDVDVNIVDSADDENSRLSNSNLGGGTAGGAGQTELVKEHSGLENQQNQQQQQQQQEEFVTHFHKQMLRESASPSGSTSGGEGGYSTPVAVRKTAELEDEETREEEIDEKPPPLSDENRKALLEKLDDLRKELADVKTRRQAQEQEIASIENQALKQRFKSLLNGLIVEEKEKQKQYEEVAARLQRR